MALLVPGSVGVGTHQAKETKHEPIFSSRRLKRCSSSVIKEPVPASEALQDIQQKEGRDVITIGEGVLSLSTLLSGLIQSALVKLVSKKISQDMTMRNDHTTQKLLALMERKEKG